MRFFVPIFLVFVSAASQKTSPPATDNNFSETVELHKIYDCGEETGITIPVDLHLSPLELEFHRLVNQYRKSRGLEPLQLDGRLNRVARYHSRAMAVGVSPFGHNHWEQRFEQIGYNFPNFGGSENVAWFDDRDNLVSHTVLELVKSPPHERNLTGNFHLTGVGIFRSIQGRHYFTQIFINCSDPMVYRTK